MYDRLAAVLTLPEWAGRLWIDSSTALGLMALVALVALLARLADARAGVAAAVVWLTARLYSADTRDLSHAAAALSSVAIGTAGLGLAALAPLSPRGRTLALALGVAVLALESWAFGHVSIVVVSAASVAVAWSSQRRSEGGLAALLAGALTLGAIALALVPLDLHAAALGTCGPTGAAATPPTFDRVVADLGHGFFPWSALLPFALASLVEPPPLARASESTLRVLLLTGVTFSTALGALSHHCKDPAPFAGAVFVAGAIGLWIRDLARGARVSGAILVCIGLLTTLLALDFVRIPAKRGVAFGWGADAEAVGALEDPQAAALFIASAALTLSGAAVAWLAGAVDRLTAWRRHVQGPALFAGALLGALLVQFGYYRGLGTRLSPRLAFQTYERRAGPDDALALLGVSDHDAKHARAQPALVTSDAQTAVAWLTSTNSPARRFIALGGEELPRLNAEFRALRPRHNLPVIDARSSLVLLAVDHLVPGERSENPLDQLLMADLPRDLRLLDAELGERVRVAGWQLLADDGGPIGAVPAGTPFVLRVHYELLEGRVDRYCTFLHIDHRPTRFSAEHIEWQEYPLSLWRRGDRIVDTYQVELPLHFGPGRYPVFVGFGVLPCRDDRRLEVTRGAHDHDRVRAGTLTVR